MAEASHRIVGTAGHIDHGKTALVRALTGVDCDRLPEERRRGITIELGFAPWRVADDLPASVIDVPGHERFVRTMVAGASGIDAVVLVVAADDGVMPQTKEHLAVCELLGVRRGVVAITKRDLVDDEMLGLVREDVALACEGTFLEGAEVVPCSSMTGEGIEELRAAVASALRAAPPRAPTGAAFLPVDRVFTKAGFGTVVTGTLLTGALRVGEDVDALPGPRGRPLLGLKARGLQVHGEAVEEALPGRRVALNLRGNGHDEISRGDAIVSAKSREATRALLVDLAVLPLAPVLEERDELSLHIGTTERLVRLVPLEAPRLEPGARSVARLVAAEPFGAFAGQRFVLRKPGLHGQGTVAGGVVVDPHPRAGKGSFARWGCTARALTSQDLAARVLALVTDGRERGVGTRELARRLPPWEDVAPALEQLRARGEAVAIDVGGERVFVASAHVEAVEARLVELTAAFHRERPLLVGIPARELESQLPEVARHLAGAALDRLSARAALVRDGGAVRAPSHDPSGGGLGDTLRALERRYEQAGLTPPLEEEAQKALSLSTKELRDALAELKRRGRLSRLGDLHFHASALEELKSRVAGHFERAEALTTADFKALAGGVSRKFAIPLLEWLDGQGATVRRGDVRLPPGRR